MGERDDVGGAGSFSRPKTSKKPTVTNSTPKFPADMSAEDVVDVGSFMKPLKPMKPTIIRPHSKIQPKDQTFDTEGSTISPLLPQKQSLSSLPLSSPPVPLHSSHSTKPRSRNLAAEEEPFSTTPALSRSDLSFSVQGNIQALPRQSLPTQSNLAEASSTPLSPTSSAALQKPKRPLNPPHYGLLGNSKGNVELHEKAKPETKAETNAESKPEIKPKTKTERQFSQAQLRSVDLSNLKVIHGESETNKTESSENRTILSKPQPKPRPKTLSSAGFKDGAEVTPSGSEYSSINKKPLPSNLPFQTVTFTGSKMETAAMSGKNNMKDNFDVKTGQAINLDLTGDRPNNSKELGSMPSHPQSVHGSTVSQLAKDNNMLTGLTEYRNLGSPASQKSTCHGNPPSRPSTAAPIKGRCTSSAEDHSQFSDHPARQAERSSNVGTAERSSSGEIAENPRSVGIAEISSSIGRVQQAASSQPCTSLHEITDAPSLPGRPGPGHPLYSYMSRQPHGIALHDYTARQPDELSFSVNDIVILVKQMDENWTVGRMGDNVGLYPTSFVEIKYPIGEKKWMDSLGSVDSWSASGDNQHSSDILTGPRCKARFDFEGDGEGELTLEDGDVVQIVERVGTEWLRGQHQGRQGIFPSSFVEIIEDLPSNRRSQWKDVSVSALFDFDGKNGELSFKAGDTITVSSQVDLEWLFGDCNGQKGHFPAAFVSHIPPNLPEYKPNHSAQGQPQEFPKAEQDGKIMEHKDSSSLGEYFWDSRETGLGFCRAMFDSTDPSPGDLEFKKSDRIEILEFIGEDWARGRLGNKEGLFPLRLVAEELNSPPHSPEPEVAVKIFGKVLHDFNGETTEDLKIKEGDIIEVEDFADINKNWRWGILNGKRGMFPADFVQIME